jgi:dihydrofolate synthase/folylpolyglutamate synthase
MGATLLQLGTDFHITSDHADKFISWRSNHQQIPEDWRQIANLQAPFYGVHQRHNLAGVVAALAVTSEMSQISIKHLHRGLDAVTLPARCQMICEKPMVILDVAHNADSARELANFLQAHPVDGKTHAVVGILKDKAPEPVFSSIVPHVDCWYLASLEGDRGQTAVELAEKFTNIYPDQIVRQFENPLEAFTAARQSADNEDRIVVFGSFYTVGDIIEAFEHDSYVL